MIDLENSKLYMERINGKTLKDILWSAEGEYCNVHKKTPIHS